MRVLHAPCNVGNQAVTMSRFERLCGVDSAQVSNYRTWLEYPGERVLGDCRDRSPRTVARRLRHVVTAPLRYDVLHYYFGRSLACWDDYGGPNPLWFADLEAARRLGRTVVMTLQGCDVRLASASHRHYAVTPCADGACSAYATCVHQLDAQRQRLIEDILPRCDRLFYLNPELRRYLPRGDFLPYATVDPDAVEVVPPRTEGPVRILHAPSDTGTKGTAAIVAAIDALSTQYDIEFIHVEKTQHRDAMRLYRDADIVIDQVLAGWYGGLAVEVMAMGKPVACFIRDEDLEFVPQAFAADLPFHRIHLDTLTDDLAALIDRRAEWPTLSAAARSFVERWHHPHALAQAMVQIYRDPQAPFILPGAG